VSWGLLSAFLWASWGQLGPSVADLRAMLDHLGPTWQSWGLGGFGRPPTRFRGLGQFLRDVPCDLGASF
jgi:hypothetical protein